MLDEPTIEHIQTHLNELEEEKQALVKKKQLWKEYQNHWHQLLQEEQRLLEEVAYLSQGTVAATHAADQLHELEEESSAAKRYFGDIEEGFSKKKKQLYAKEEDLTTAYYEAKRKAEAHDEI
jgi:hypothetical protein